MHRAEQEEEAEKVPLSDLPVQEDDTVDRAVLLKELEGGKPEGSNTPEQEDDTVDRAVLLKALMSDPRLTAETPAMRAVGYRQAITHLAGHGSLDDLEARACAATRQLAKRQLTLLRHLDDVSWLDPTEKSWKSAARSQIARFLHTTVC